MIAWVQSILARAAVTLILASTILLSVAGRVARGVFDRIRPPKSKGSGSVEVFMVGTFYNAGWFESHVRPLVASEAVSRVHVICDKALRAVEKVEYHTPGTCTARIFGRTIARFLTLLRASRGRRDALLMGYHIMPNALLCLVVARWRGCRAAYQMTGGPIQIIGGGIGSENTLLRRQLKSSRLREWLLEIIVRRFDWVFVRGSSASEYVRSIGAGDRCVVLPGGVDTRRFAPNGRMRIYDLIAVGRLVQVKRYDRMLNLVAAVKRRCPQIRLAIVGEGPLAETLSGQCESLGLGPNVDFLGQRDDVPHLLGQSRAFILTSENEGLSIAMLEAMAAGLPAIVPDIGDLSDVVRDGETGLLIDPTSPEVEARRIADFLECTDSLDAMSARARLDVVAYADAQNVAARWTELLSPGGAP